MLLTLPIALENAYVRLEPLAPEHEADLAAAAVGLEHTWYTSVPRPEGIAADIAQRLAWRDEGHMNPWAVRRLDTGRVVGTTTFCNIDQPNRHVEIGHTWIGREAQRTAGHSWGRIENTTVSRSVPSGPSRWLRSTPSCRAPSRAIAARD